MTPIIEKIRDLWNDAVLGLPPEPDPVPPSPPLASGTPAPLTDQQLRDLKTFKLLIAQQQVILNQLEDYKKKFGSPDANPSSDTLEKILSSQGFRDNLQTGLYAFFPYLVPFQKAAEALPEIRPFGLDLSPRSLLAYFRDFQQQAEESAKAFKESIAGAIRNPTSLDDLSKGDLFVIDEDALNEIVASALKNGPAGKKLRNLKIKIDGDELKISGEYKTKLMWVDFTARLDLEQKDGKTRGSLRKVKAIGFDLTSMFQEDIIGAFRKFNIEPPADAKLNDLSWVHLIGIKRLEVRHDLIILEREPAGTGPT